MADGVTIEQVTNIVKPLIKGLQDAWMEHDTAKATAKAAAAVGSSKAGTRRLPPFSSGAPEDWEVWRHNFCLAQKLQGWSNRTARNIAGGSFEGTAFNAAHSVLVRDVPAAGQNDAEDFNLLLDEYSAIFAPRSARMHLDYQLDAAKQKEAESIITWAGRLKSLYRRSCSEIVNRMTAVEFEANRHLIRAFVNGLKSSLVAQDVRIIDPRTFQSAVDAADNAYGNHYMEKYNARKSAQLPPDSEAQTSNGNGRNRKTLSQLQDNDNRSFNDNCHFCSQPGHRWALCPTITKVNTFHDSRRGRGGRGGFKSRGGNKPVWNQDRKAGLSSSSNSKHQGSNASVSLSQLKKDRKKAEKTLNKLDVAVNELLEMEGASGN
jgi:hypothetical protein